MTTETINQSSNSASCALAATLDDMSLVQLCKLSDVSAFERLVQRYEAKLFRLAQHITHNREDAEEAVQEAFLKAFRNLSCFQQKSQFSTWLFRIAVNESLTKVRKQRYAKEVSMDGDAHAEQLVAVDQIASWAPNPEQLYGVLELRSILRNQLQQLHPTLRVTFILRDIEGLSAVETAEVLNLTEQAVKSRLWRARLKLRQLLTAYFAFNSPSFERATRTTSVLLGQIQKGQIQEERAS